MPFCVILFVLTGEGEVSSDPYKAIRNRDMEGGRWPRSNADGHMDHLT